MSDQKRFIVMDKDDDFRGGFLTKTEAMERAKGLVTDDRSYSPYVIYQAIVEAKLAAAPVTLVDL